MDHIRDLTPDPENRRKRTPRNLAMIAEALQAVGASRSIVIDETGAVLAGNGVLEAAADVGITKLKVIDVDGETIIAVRRTGLSDEQKRALAIYDNRTGELAAWDVEQLRVDALAGLALEPFWTDAERAKLLGPDAPESFPVVDESIEVDYKCPSCGYAWSGRRTTTPPVDADAEPRSVDGADE